MALRFSACDQVAFEASQGVVGVFDQADHQDLTAVGCRDATMGILQELCEPSAPIPYAGEPWTKPDIHHCNNRNQLHWTMI